MPRGVDQGPAEGAVAEQGPSSAPVGLRENVAAPLTAAHVISRLRRCSFATRLSLWFVASRSNLSESTVAFRLHTLPSHFRSSSCRGWSRPLRASRSSLYPSGPPQSSGGHARPPSTQTGVGVATGDEKTSSISIR